MKLAAKILSGLAVAVIGAAAIAGVFWINFRSLDFGGTPAPRLEGGTDNTGKDSGSVLTNPTGTGEEAADNVAGEGSVVPEERAIPTDISEKPAPVQDKVTVSVAPDPAKTAENNISDNYTLTRAGVVDETNRQRRIYLGSGHDLAENALLDRAAQAKVDDMFAGQYFEHVSPLGDDAAYFIGRTGYQYIAIGENLAMGNYKGDVALVRAWMDSPGHRENILKNGFTEIGVAAGYGNFDGRRVWLAVQEFGTPQSACPQVDESLSDLIDSQKAKLDDHTAGRETQSAVIDMKKDVAESLQEELQEMSAAGDSYSELKAKERELNDAVAEVNELVEVYNESVREARVLYEDYKQNVEDYNSEVNAYNDCIGAI